MIASGLWEPEDDGRVENGEPVIGWRTWIVEGDRLSAIAVPEAWRPGENRATCFAQRCSDVPGRGCHCGFWALRSPVEAMYKAHGRRAAAHLASVTAPSVAVGLIHSYGAIAVHGTQGFRAQYASVACLFADAPYDTGGHEREQVAAAYGVPCISLEAALSIGLLHEFGVEPEAIVELRRWLAMGRPLPGVHMPGPPPLKAA